MSSSTVRGAQKAEMAAARYIKILVDASSGPRQRMEQIASTYEGVGSAISKNYPELFHLEDRTIANISLGSATRDEAEALGRAFVGDGFTVYTYRQDKTKLILRSAEGRRVSRSPIFKKAENKVQANFEVFAPKGSPRTEPLSDACLDITE